MRQILLALLVTASACESVSTNPNDLPGKLPPSDGPTVQFDPANSIIPFPNDLIPRDPTTHKLQIPASCNESPATTAVRTGTLNQLTGFGTYESALQLTFTDPVDMTTLAGNIVLYERAKGGAAVTPASATAIPTLVLPASTATQYPTGCANASTTVTAVTLIPKIPLDENSTYTVAVLTGINTATGTAFLPSTTWALVRSATNPITFDSSGNVTSNRTPLDPTNAAQLAQMQSLSGLWTAESPLLTFLDGALAGKARTDILLAWDFTTQTTVDPLNAAITGTPATKVNTAGITGLAGAYPDMFSLAGASSTTAEGLLIATLGAQADPTGSPSDQITEGTYLCNHGVPCSAVGDIFLGGLPTTNFQVPTANTLVGGAMIPGAWSDPVNPTVQSNPVIQVLAFLPAGTAPTKGWPVVIFGHGLGEQKEDLFVIGSQLAAAGYASVAIDDVASGSRAVQTSTAAALGCDNVAALEAGASSPLLAVDAAYRKLPQCFAAILTTDLGTTRDNIRQTVLDMMSLVGAIKACAPPGCVALTPHAAGDASPTASTFPMDATRIGYMGQSLGGIIGTTFTASSADVKASVLNVPGVGLLDILENTQSLAIRCSLVNALIEAGVVTGDLSNATLTTGECTTQDWVTQPGYQTFASAARWVLDPGDGANYAFKLAPKKFIIQEVIGDMVVPNIAANNEGALVGLTPTNANAYDATALPAAAPIPTASATGHVAAWIQYPTTTIDAYQHGSLLAPLAGAAGTSGTAQMQTDAITFMALNN